MGSGTHSTGVAGADRSNRSRARAAQSPGAFGAFGCRGTRRPRRVDALRPSANRSRRPCGAAATNRPWVGSCSTPTPSPALSGLAGLCSLAGFGGMGSGLGRGRRLRGALRGSGGRIVSRRWVEIRGRSVPRNPILGARPAAARSRGVVALGRVWVGQVGEEWSEVLVVRMNHWAASSRCDASRRAASRRSTASGAGLVSAAILHPFPLAEKSLDRGKGDADGSAKADCVEFASGQHPKDGGPGDLENGHRLDDCHDTA